MMMKLPPLRTLALFIIPIIVLAVYPLVGEQGYLTYTLLLILTYSVIGLFYNMLLGYLGIPFLGPMVFFAVGGYTAGYLALNNVNPALGIIVGGVFSAGSSFAFSLLSMRLRGLYMALYSLIFTLFFQQLIGRQDIPVLFHIFFGAIGQTAIPDIQLNGFLFRNSDGVAYYYLAIVFFVVSAIALKVILGSRFGVAFRSIRDAETYASTLGIGIFRIKIIAFLLSGFFIGVAGALLTMFYGDIGLTVLDTSNMLLFLTMVVFGGLGTFFGPIAGAVLLVPIDNYLTSFGAWRLLVWGAAVMVVVLVAPEGIVGKLRKLFAKKEKVPVRRTTTQKREEEPAKDLVATSARTA